MASRWEPFMDDGGNLYFYNHMTGESVWELPPEEAEDDALPEIEAPLITELDKELSPFVVAAGVVDTVAGLVQAVNDSPTKHKKQAKKAFISPAAAIRRHKNDAKSQRRAQREIGIATERYMNLILPPVADSSALSPGKKGDEDKMPRRVGSLFTLEDSAQWQREVEAERLQERRANRKLRQQHRVHVRTLKEQLRLLLQLRSELTKYLLGDIRCTPDLLQQKILLLSSQSAQSIMATTTLEPEIAEKLEALQREEQQERLVAVKRVFELLDGSKTGRIRLLNVLTGVFTNEAHIQQLAPSVQGLSVLLTSPRLQQFIVSFASRKQNDCDISFNEFRELIGIIEDVWNYFSAIKRAVEDAENEIDAAFEAAAQRPGTGVARARMGLVSKKKAEHELAQLQEKAALLRSMAPAESEEELWRLDASLIEPKEEWEKNHHHRYIERGSLYCCLCRRRKWDLALKSTDDAEQSYRDSWATVCEIRLKEAEIRLLGGNSGGNPENIATDGIETSVPDTNAHTVDFITQMMSTTDDDKTIVVLETLQAVVLVIESMESEPSYSPTSTRSLHTRAHRRRHRKVTKKSKFHDIDPLTGKSPLQIIELELQTQEFARRALFEEERTMRIEIERFQRRAERPLLRFQETAQDGLTRILERCVSLPPLLSNFEFERCLSMPSSQRLTLLMMDSSSPLCGVSPHDKRVVLYTVPHRNDSEAKHSFERLKILQKRLNSPFIATMQLVDIRTYQNFSESGMLLESWLVQFVAVESFPRGSWLDFYRYCLDSNLYGYAQIEQHVLRVFRDIATGISVMHSLGVLHLNIQPKHIYICTNAESEDPRSFLLKPSIKIAGLLAWTTGYDATGLAEGDILDRLYLNYAPPEALEHKPITAKSDVWMLGCAMFDSLLSWQHSQLASVIQQHYSPIIFSSCSIQDLLLMLPLSTGSLVRSLLRMLLQREPKSRPDMTQVAEYISFAGVTQTLTSRS